MNRNKLILLAAIALVVAVFIALDGHKVLTLENLQAHQTSVAAWIEQNLLVAVTGYAALYVVVTALSLPGATIMTLAGGAFFGNFYGLVAVSIASTIGASLAFLVARFLLRDTLRDKYRDTIARIDRGIEKDGAFYLATLRLVPVFPFFLINLALGLTSMKLRTYALVSWVAMLPGTFVFVNAGTQLGQIQSTSDIVSADLLLSFALLGLFPLIAKFVVGFLRRRRVYAGWQKPAHFDYNLLVIGGGSAGLVSAYIAAAVKAKVALIEKDKMGGDCLNTGCVPSKALIRSAKAADTLRHANRYGLESVPVKGSFKTIMERVQSVIRKVEPHDSPERYEQLGVECIAGEASFVSPWEIQVRLNDGGTQRLTARSIVVATGGKPALPPIPGLEDMQPLTSENLWQLEEQPQRLLVLGGGPIGSELAHAFARLGSQVTQVERGECLLAKEDTDVSALILQQFEADGIDVRLNHEATEFRVEEGEKVAYCDHNGTQVRIPFDEVLVAVGRAANTENLGLDEIGVETLPNGTVPVEADMSLRYPNVFACGDVAGPYQFTHAAAHQAWYAAVNGLFGQFRRFRVDYRVMPWVTFTSPEVARVGLSETEAKEQGIAYEVTRYGLDDLDRAITESEGQGFIKVLTPPGKDRILGAVVVGAHAGEILAEFTLAMKHGLGLNKILGTIHPYPTWNESAKFAAGEWKKAHAPGTVLKLLEKFHGWRRGKNGMPNSG
ncbi:Pyruvate/2-oxoglutarate dehydrogenase complex, dihydrolipoamide dehydrogenase (E3) component [Marinobacter persicus]|uniref:Pyruvate/2-oxoglutarate dehydrogenase complex, dihydrolipoamide dehydrogenase (E3) component n=1 Tax=Marinobacter persicus TaxID=930118 RepID=A0A1I3VA01_9GAMM|nr:bifunctional TVP38/TMEM64 family protein/FAD-dependent oxidoreductase [Marinobacter persicus]GHD41402.1 pyridine nucleotide-disulfide oxidoreductase [Marinobacter persicus]SFJ92002.1 Pyruvate/2-oxoglutarate dehydrogenase complex, dihydrolipoamide dehydrogenase (E3) component [Marinobacter persicus]